MHDLTDSANNPYVRCKTSERRKLFNKQNRSIAEQEKRVDVWGLKAIRLPTAEINL